eukprot:CAMPEP_0182878166 /NCGR_PEP_ID=MMETSP0034_2-20130328/15193_1 /TAXON_ID=156128 /ORGANISM="Nephroselmis pyriformis, Strain CCMP717" /LENGTH=251 /DNA_ID=CAMNT_0025011043 /DNA_START=45 /DNA_END=800 /DNA_ORIENTATION=-
MAALMTVSQIAAKPFVAAKAQVAKRSVAVRAIEDRDMSLEDIAGVAQAASKIADPTRKNWAPGSKIPAYLDGSMVGDFGYDPLGLGKEPASLILFREAELQNARWAMLGTAGILAQEVSGQGYWVDSPAWVYEGGNAEYLGNALPFGFAAVIGFQLFGMAFAENARYNETDVEKRMYPGGAFDPMGFSKGGDFETLKLKEIKNGRLAMFSIVGYYAQAYCTGEGPIANLQAHLADPWNVNCGTNGVSVPLF